MRRPGPQLRDVEELIHRLQFDSDQEQWLLIAGRLY